MLVSVAHRFVFLSMPKAASTAIEAALAPHCNITVTGPPQLKHTTYRSFMRHFAPLLLKKCQLQRSDYQVVCLFRDPLSWLDSWYRYRAREALAAARGPRGNNYTGDISFAEFLEAYVQERPPAFARVGNPYTFVTSPDGAVGVDRIFKYEELETFRRFIRERLAVDIDFPLRNVSAQMDSEVPEAVLARVRQKLAPAIRLYQTL